MNQKIKYTLLLTLISGLASPTACAWAASGKKATVEELAAEATARDAADSGLQTQINTIELTPGPQGLTGATGQQGPAGADGAVGPQGTIGRRGARGLQGFTGADGTQGPQGEEGINADNDELFSRIAELEASLAAYEARFANSDIDGDGYTPADGDCDDADYYAFPGAFPNDCGVIIYQIGDPGPANGIVFYITDGGLHGLEAALRDLPRASWGCFGTSIATQQVIGSGTSNTEAIVANCSEANIAAKLPDDYELNGFSDWFLPSKDELNQLYNNRFVVGGFLVGFNSVYWSSSQYSSDRTWVHHFGGGAQNESNKTSIHGVRAIRAF